ncbi:hypothetical protein B0A55_06861 [Friedmanniomyces simplex]|uniref:GAE domain-containing protein n=1 Tax=Friedmanniomyces simplex TaxID=329884 RepID=A0A4U0X8M5_9PEZI|nr:hypothetical protein B0A55_06861 [Friedmanniomyces simplex]
MADAQSNGNGPPATAPAQAPAGAAGGGDDEWEFSSSLPDQPTELTVTNSRIKTVFSVHRENDEIVISSRISNNTAQAISDLTFQLAVTKGLSLHLQPQSSRSLAPSQSNGITQTIRLQGVERGKGNGVKLRWRAGYSIAGVGMNEQGEIVGLGVL